VFVVLSGAPGCTPEPRQSGFSGGRADPRHVPRSCAPGQHVLLLGLRLLWPGRVGRSCSRSPSAAVLRRSDRAPTGARRRVLRGAW